MSNEHVSNAFHYALSQIAPPVERDMRPIAAAIAPLATIGEPVKPVTPVTVEVSDDENTVKVTTRLEFVEADGIRCCLCAACGKEDICETAPCLETNRKDGRRGYFREVRG